MAQRIAVDRSSWARPAPLTPRKKRFRGVRRVLWATVFLVVLAIAAREYLLHVYAPRLRVEARTVPARVREQLAQQGASYFPVSQISPNLQHAIVAIEDRRFYSHPGIDPVGMMRALWVDVTNQHIDQGGSTLEEQLVKRAFVFQDSNLHDKLRTIGLAWAVDQEFPKWKILELYLNAAYYGQGAYGAGAAARTYFGTDALHLTLSQAAFLASLPQAPSIYGAHPTSPTVMARQQTVLRDMRDQGYITSDQEQVADNTRLTFALPNP
jgi:membrane peptidoglycan carboxypeptidase